MTVDEKFMKRAIANAKRAASRGEVPVGAVIVKDGEVISVGSNMRERGMDALLHAEIIAIRRACRKLGRWRLSDCDLYVTLEPCAMCAGAAINSRLRRVVFGAYDSKAGSLGTVIDLNKLGYNHLLEVEGGVLEKECAALLSDFFKELRKR
ncbi:MAG: tRNA adenosine(34) deaminase TadA [Eubacteriales bacterium]|nr:tRNA adenosine(34) deaminase TadA [Eubacteriales bacterium]MDD4474850.1 tRNA adenosine(34) deaminase TadA [Eubacteriales bacterium]